MSSLGEELCLAQGELVWGGVCSAYSVFSGMDEEKESKPGKIDDSLLLGGAFLVGGLQCNEGDYWD